MRFARTRNPRHNAPPETHPRFGLRYHLRQEALFCVSSLFAKQFEPVPKKQVGDFLYRGMLTTDLPSVLELVRRSGAALAPWTQRLLARDGDRLAVLALDMARAETIIGVDIFYFGVNDLSHRMIHEGFIAVLAGYEGRGIATSMREHAAASFSGKYVLGISTRISVDNLASIRSGARSGFSPVMSYVEDGSPRVYLVRPLASRRLLRTHEAAAQAGMREMDVKSDR